MKSGCIGTRSERVGSHGVENDVGDSIVPEFHFKNNLQSEQRVQIGFVLHEETPSYRSKSVGGNFFLFLSLKVFKVNFQTPFKIYICKSSFTQ